MEAGVAAGGAVCERIRADGDGGGMQCVGVGGRGGAEGVGGDGGGADRAADREHAVVCAGRRRAITAARERRGTVYSGSGGSARIFESGGTDAGAVCGGPVQRESRGADVPYGRPCEVAAERRIVVFGTAGRAGKEPGVPDRVGRDRGGVAGAGRSGAGGGDSA